MLMNGDITACGLYVGINISVFRGQVCDGFSYLRVRNACVIRVPFREYKSGFSAICTEYGVDGQVVVRSTRRFFYIIVGNLDGFATTVPAIGRIVGAPEWVVNAFGDAIQKAVIVAYAVVSGSLIAEVWKEGLLCLELLPSGGLGGGGYAGIVFGLQPCDVEFVVDGGYLLFEFFKGAQAAIFITQGIGNGA